MPARSAFVFALSLFVLWTASPAQAELFTVAGPLQGVVFREVASGLPAITAIVHSRDARLLLALRDGRVMVWSNGRLLPEPLLDIRPLVGTNGEGGLLGLAFHPRYADNGLFFVHYTDNQGDTRLARYQTLPNNPNRADPASAAILLAVEQPFSNHNGGQLSFGPDGFLYLGLGDGGGAGDPQCNAQRTNTLLGKILRINVDRRSPGRAYAIPDDNPFRNGPFLPEVWAAGLRNPWRFSFDRITGDLWIGDVGQGEREEIDLQVGRTGGVNYGWSPMEGTLCFGGNGCPGGTPSCNAPGLVLPVLEYGHDGGNCSVTGGFVYRGTAVRNLVGTYLFGDFCSGRVWGAVRQEGELVVRLANERVSQLITFGEDAAGEVYLGTVDGRLLQVATTAPAGQGDRVGVFNPDRSRFLLARTNAAGPAQYNFGFGRPDNGWIPLAGDWNGDGRDSAGFYDPVRGLFRLRNALSPGISDVLFAYGPPGAGWLPIVGDWNNDGRDGVGLYNPQAGVFHLRNTLSSGPDDRTFRFGPRNSGWLPVAGSFDSVPGDDVGLYDPAGSVFRLLQSQGPRIEHFGPPGGGWLPIAGDWNGDVGDGIGLYDPVRSVFHLNDLNGQPERTFQFGNGNQGWLPLAGNW